MSTQKQWATSPKLAENWGSSDFGTGYDSLRCPPVQSTMHDYVTENERPFPVIPLFITGLGLWAGIIWGIVALVA